jgi:hypothetical protein
MRICSGLTVSSKIHTGLNIICIVEYCCKTMLAPGRLPLELVLIGLNNAICGSNHANVFKLSHSEKN